MLLLDKIDDVVICILRKRNKIMTRRDEIASAGGKSYPAGRSEGAPLYKESVMKALDRGFSPLTNVARGSEVDNVANKNIDAQTLSMAKELQNVR